MKNKKIRNIFLILFWLFIVSVISIVWFKVHYKFSPVLPDLNALAVFFSCLMGVVLGNLFIILINIIFYKSKTF